MGCRQREIRGLAHYSCDVAYMLHSAVGRRLARTCHNGATTWSKRSPRLENSSNGASKQVDLHVVTGGFVCTVVRRHVSDGTLRTRPRASSSRRQPRGH